MNNSAPTYAATVQQQWVVQQPITEELCPVTMKEWERIKEAVLTIKNSSNLYYSLGFLLLGAFLSSVAPVWLAWCEYAGGGAIAGATVWTAVSVLCLVCGIFALQTGKQHKKVTRMRAEDVIAMMLTIEERRGRREQ